MPGYASITASSRKHTGTTSQSQSLEGSKERTWNVSDSGAFDLIASTRPIDEGENMLLVHRPGLVAVYLARRERPDTLSRFAFLLFSLPAAFANRH